MRIPALVGCLVLATAAGAPVPKKAAPPPAKKSAPAAKKRPAPGKPSAAASKKRPSPSRKSPSKSKSKKRLPSWRTSQQAPTRERYLEIQQALVARGFLAGPPSGVWGAESVAALKKFQASQNLEPSGKLDSLSLIALGLGPKRETNGAKPPPVSEPKQP